jgi:hypothetical protein
VLGYDSTPVELRNGLGGVDILTRLSTVETAVVDASDVTNIKNVIGYDGSKPVTAEFQPAMTDVILELADTVIVATSSSDNVNIHKLFNKNTSDSFSSATDYHPVPGSYTSAVNTLVDEISLPGEFVELTVTTGDPVKLGQITITPNSFLAVAETNSPRSCTVAAYDGSAYVKVLQRSTEGGWTTEPKTYVFDKIVPATRYRFIVTVVGNSDVGSGQDKFALNEIEYSEAPPFVVSFLYTLEQRVADLVYKLYGLRTHRRE